MMDSSPAGSPPSVEDAPGGLCVVHLVWAPLGLEPFRNFVAAYRRSPGGMLHRLLIVYNGLPAGSDHSAYQQELAGVVHDELVLPQAMQDIPAYFAAAETVSEASLCFLNSYCVMLDACWLQKLHTCLQIPGTGLVGTTGSWGSVLSYALLEAGKPSVYTGLFDRFALDGPSRPRVGWLRGVVRAFRRRLFTRRRLRDARRWFGLFPAYHLRTNAFLLRRETFLRVRRDHIHAKVEALAFESGRLSLTAQVLAEGQSVRVVGRDGVGYEKERWAESETFWQRDQGNLLIADNQTLDYERADPERRQFLARFAWGNQALTPRDETPSTV